MRLSVWPWFCGWFVVGALALLGLLTLLTIGPYVLLVTAAATALLATRRRASVGLPGLVSGLGVPLLYVAFLNRAGPGTVCTTTGSGESCVDEWNPWWWLTVGTGFFIAGLLLVMVVRRRADGHGTRQ